MDLTNEDFTVLRDLIRARSGIWLSESKASFLKVRLNTRFKATGMETVRDYRYFLKYDPGGEQALEALIDAVTVNETYFFREADQLEDFSHEIVPRLLERNGGMGPLRIWSAACSTGEEPYTLAMLLLENGLESGRAGLEILGSDISSRVLRTAREGLYDDYSIRHVPPLYRLKYFDETDGKHGVKPRVKRMVKFAGINLVDPFATGRIHAMDCVFCRNILIYFDDGAKAGCIEHLYRTLNKGGYLLLGHAESLAHVDSPFEVVRLRGFFPYLSRTMKRWPTPSIFWKRWKRPKLPKRRSTLFWKGLTPPWAPVRAPPFFIR